MRSIAIAISLFAFAAALASWPTYQGDNQRSGRSPVAGPADPQIKWTVDLNGPIITSPVVGPDGTIYTGSVWSESLLPKAYINAINPNGTFKWRFETTFIDDQSLSTPAIGPEGNVYVGTATGVFYAISSNGVELWRYEAFNKIDTHPLVTSNGTVIVKMDGILFAFSPSGQQLWQFPIGSNFPNSPALATDGTIYVHGAGSFYAINPNGSLKWSVTLADSFATPAVAPDGTIITANWDRLTAHNPATGAIIWTTSKAVAPYGSPAIDAQGNIYAVDQNWVRKFSPTGQMLWEDWFLYEVNRIESTYSSPVIDPAGRLYFGLGSGKRYALNSAKGIVIYDAASGQKLLNFLLPEAPSTSSPAIGSDGTLYVGCLDGKLYALADEQDQQVLPQSFTIERGILVGGNLASLLASDDDRLVVREAPPLALGLPSVAVVVLGTSPNLSPAQLTQVVEYSTTAVPAGNVAVRIQMFNFQTNAYDTVDTRPGTSSDTTVEILIVQDPARYIKQSNGEVRTRIQWFDPGTLFSFGWRARLDHVMWLMP